MKSKFLMYALWVGVFVMLMACNQDGDQSDAKSENGDNQQVPYDYENLEAQTTASGLTYYIVEEGDGPKPQKGDQVVANYHGLLEDGTVFDSSFDRGEPFSFKLGQGQVIPGWDEGFGLLKKGTKAVLVVPPDMAYGSQERGKIPANSTLYFHVELVDIKQPFTPWPYEEANLQTTPSGLKYVHLKKGTGKQPQMGNRVKMNFHLVLKDSASVLANTFEREPFTAILGKGQLLPGWEEGLTLMKEGGQSVFVIPPQLGLGSQEQQGIPANSTLEMRVELLEVEEFKPFEPYAYDESQAQSTASGLKYVIIEEGSGPKPQAGETINVHYHGMLKDGSVFDSSFDRGEPISFPVGQGQVIKGWDEGLMLLKKGTKAVLIVPPELGYGDTARPGIPPGSTMYFHVHLMPS